MIKQILRSDQAFTEFMVAIAAGIMRETDAKINALEAKIARLEAAQEEPKTARSRRR